MDPVTVLITVEKGRDWNTDRTLKLPAGTPYVVAQHDPGEWAQGVMDGVQACDTDLVILSDADTWMVEHEANSVEMLSDLAWDCDVTYGNCVFWIDGKPRWALNGEQFCPHRLRQENYIPNPVCVRKSKFLEVGGITSGMWDFHVRMLDAGAKFKYVGEAIFARDGLPEDESPTPVPSEPKATFYYQSTPGTAYWRCLVPSRHLPGHAVYNMPKRIPVDGKLTLPNHHGTAVFQFAGNLEHHVTMKYMRDQGIRTLVEVDDTYLHWHPSMMKKAGWTEKIKDHGYSVECHRATVGMADGVIVTTETLARQYRKLNNNVFVCPNQIDPADWPEPQKPDDGVLRIGWFASGSHKDDLLLPERALSWASEQPNVEVVLIGYGVINGKPLYKFPGGFRHFPWSNDFGVYRKFLAQLDIGLAPVKATPWAQCRSDLKALEYGMAQAYPVVSDVAPYETVDVPKAKTPKDFLRHVQQVVADPDGTRQKAKEWRDYVLAERTIQRNIYLWKEAVHA